ncbi:MAG: flavodoxin family protein [Thermoplasmata archaeon]
MKALIVYYSQTGNTEKAAEMLAENLGSQNVQVEKIFIERSKERSYEENVEEAKKKRRQR